MIGLLLLLALTPAPTPTCAQVPPGAGEYKLAMGTAVAEGRAPKQQAAALEAAREAARAQLQTDLCGVHPSDCGRYFAYITDWEAPGRFDADRRQACATAVLGLEHLEPTRERDRAETTLSALGDTLAAALRAQDIHAVRLDTPRRSTGCALPELDAARMWIRSRLGNAQIAARTDLPEDVDPATLPVLELVASVQAGEVTLSATVERAEGAAITVDPVRFSAAAYDIPESGAECARVPTAERNRPEQIEATIEVATQGGALCVGQPVVPAVTVSEAAVVHVFTVAADGAAWHIWPMTGEPSVAHSVVLEPSYAVPASDGTDETLVAVVLPPTAELGGLSAMRGFCRLPGTFGERKWPAGVNLVSTTWHVTQGPECGAAPADTPTAAALEEALSSAPWCS